MTALAKRLLGEPLAHFLVLGGLMFALYAAFGDRGAEAPRTIVVTRGRVESLEAQFALAWGDPPTPNQRDALIQDYVREEVLYREGLALGLDRDDAVVRSRIAQKMQFVSEDDATRPDPTDAELQAFLDAHREKFDVEPAMTFEQVFLDPNRRGSDLDADGARLTEELRAGAVADPAPEGDPSRLPFRLDDASVSEVKTVFGDEFAAAVASLPEGRWSGPVRSSRGAHVVRVIARTPGRERPLAEVHDAVRREWEVERQRVANDKRYRELLKSYTVRIEAPVEAAR